MSFSRAAYEPQVAEAPPLHFQSPERYVPAPVSPSYCLPQESQFRIIELNELCGDGTFQVVDHADNSLFTCSKNSFWSSNQLVHDDSGRPILYLKQKGWTLRDRWDVYRGQKPHGPEDLIFTMKIPSVFQWKITYSIFFSGKQTADFTVSADFWGKRDQIRYCYNDVVIAEAERKFKFLKPSELIVTANAGVDRMFIAAILIIFQTAAKQRRTASANAATSGQ